MKMTLDFIVIQDCARKFIHAALWPGNGEWLHSKNNWTSALAADIQTIWRDCNSRVDSVPNISGWVSHSLSLNSINSLLELNSDFNALLSLVVNFMGLRQPVI
jgi:hypothetical protein